MYLLYVDESGDTGPTGSPYFGLSGLVVHELRWQTTLDHLLRMRARLRDEVGLKLREEIHASHFIHKPGPASRIDKHMRLRALRYVLRFEAQLADVACLNVIVDKRGKAADYDVFEHAWRALIQRFENTIARRNFPGPANSDERGMLIVDRTHEKKLRNLLRRLRKYNPIPSRTGQETRNLPLQVIVEDPTHRDSAASLFIQTVDVNAYFLLQREMPCGYVQRKGARNYFNILEPILCRHASPKDPHGIVRL